MLKFYSLKIKDIREETPDCKSIALEIPEELADLFTYEAGQYLTFRTTIRKKEVRRSYSLCSSPMDNEHRVAVKHIPDGLFSTFANKKLKVGDMIDVMPPLGNFKTKISKRHKRNYVAFAGGSGITPILSLMKTILKSEPNSSFTLFYLNKTVKSIIFKEEIEGLKNLHLERLTIYYCLTRERLDVPLFNGRFSKDKTIELISKLGVNPKEVSSLFLCGPEEMIFSVQDAFIEEGLKKDKVHFELFTSPNAPKKKAKVKTKKKRTGVYSKIVIGDGEKSFEFELEQNGENILDAALQNGADLPYACKGGVCCTCKAKLVEGEVNMDVNYALEPEEVKDGFILTCQAHPISDKVVVDFNITI